MSCLNNMSNSLENVSGKSSSALQSKKRKKNSSTKTQNHHPTLKGISKKSKKSVSQKVKWIEKPLDKIIAGIDMSLNSPALSILNPMTKTMNLYYCKQRLNDSNFFVVINEGPFLGWTMNVTCLTIEFKENQNGLERFQRYKAVVELLVSKIPENIIIGIENYSHESVKSYAATTLMELGGVLRLLVNEKHPTRVYEFSPKHVKKVWSNNGNADKAGMYFAYTKYELPSLLTNLNMKKIIHPIDDLVDSLAVVASVIDEMNFE